MSTDSYRYQEVVGQVHGLIIQGRVAESQRAYWETRLMSDPRSIKELHLERPIDHSQRPEPQTNADPNAYVAKSGGQQFAEWISEQKDFGQGTGEPVPPRPTFRSPTTTASGVPLDAVRRLPAEVQHSVAREPNRATAQQLIEDYTGPDGDILVEIACQPGQPAHKDVLDHSMEVEAWRNDPRVPLSGSTETSPSAAHPAPTTPTTPATPETQQTPPRPPTSASTRCTRRSRR